MGENYGDKLVSPFTTKQRAYSFILKVRAIFVEHKNPTLVQPTGKSKSLVWPKDFELSMACLSGLSALLAYTFLTS
jgi:hypothetical protein